MKPRFSMQALCSWPFKWTLSCNYPRS